MPDKRAHLSCSVEQQPWHTVATTVLILRQRMAYATPPRPPRQLTHTFWPAARPLSTPVSPKSLLRSHANGLQSSSLLAYLASFLFLSSTQARLDPHVSRWSMFSSLTSRLACNPVATLLPPWCTTYRALPLPRPANMNEEPGTLLQA